MKFRASVILLLGTSGVMAPARTWPVYRHDTALSGVSPGKGRIVKPEIKWEYYLGALRVTLATDRNSEPLNTADLEGDGRLDVYLNSRSYARGGYAAIQADGQALWAEFHNNDEGSDGLGPVGDFDGDGKLEIAVPVLNGTLLCLNAADGTHKWRIQTPVTGDVVAADVNGDGIMELLFAGRDGELHA